METPAPEVSIVIPCLDEAANAEGYAETLFDPLERTGLGCEVIFSDGGSADGTCAALERAAAGRPWVRILGGSSPASFAESLARAVKVCRAEHIVFLEADLSFSPLDIPRLLAAARAGNCDCVCGSPFLGSFEGLPPLRRLLTWSANRLLRLRFGGAVTSYTQIFKLYRAEVLKSLTFESKGFTLDAELTAKCLARGLKVAEVGVQMKARSKDSSKLKVLEETAACLRLLLRGVRV